MKNTFKRSVQFLRKLPARNLFPEESVLLYDAVLAKKPTFSRWKKSFKYQIALKAGEGLKNLSSLETVLDQLSVLKVPQTTALTFISVGGGSVGDFAGFLASIYLRGRDFVQIPSTWLAAVDSAHGGKNGLNFKNIKNQLGTIYQAQSVYVVDELLTTQPSERLADALGEVIKMGIINSKDIFQILEIKESSFSEKDLLHLLPRLVEAKMKVVGKDPLEKMGHRRILNLGHTMGHVFESYFQIPHGEAVKLGILFSARWSFNRELLKESEFIRISNLIHHLPGSQNLQDILTRIPRKNVEHLLTKDKKRTSTDSLDFIFIKNVGQVERLKVKIADVLKEFERQQLEF